MYKFCLCDILVCERSGSLNLFFKASNLSKLNFLFESLRIQKITPLINAAKKHHTENLSKLNFLFESLRIQKITPLINAAKKHHTESKNWVKKMAVTAHDKNMKSPKIRVLLILDIKSGVMVTNKYTKKAKRPMDFGKSLKYLM